MRSSSVTSGWLPDSKTAVLLALLTLAFAAIWGFLLFTLSPSDCDTAAAYPVCAVGALLLGVTYGFFCVAVILLLSAALKLIGQSGKFWLAPAQAARIGVLMLAVHVVASGALAALGMWGFKHPWYFGLLPL